MKNLRDYGQATYSQFGEDGMVEHLLTRLNPVPKQLVDIGAHDLRYLSNSCKFLEAGWRGLLIEADLDRCRKLAEDSVGLDATVRCLTVTPENVTKLVPTEAGLLSLDIDGDDYYVLEAILKSGVSPDVVIVEYNQTIPHWVEYVGSRGSRMGSSALSMVRLLGDAYQFVGCTRCNILAVRKASVVSLCGLDTDLNRVFIPDHYTMVASDYDGNPVPMAGALPFPWGRRTREVLL